jgi:hypothetical protein
MKKSPPEKKQNKGTNEYTVKTCELRKNKPSCNNQRKNQEHIFNQEIFIEINRIFVCIFINVLK